MLEENIRNFVIIAHIDSGKSTLADRFLEITGTVDARHMKPQYLDKMELERERGITIKMAPVRMIYTMTDDNNNDKNQSGHRHGHSSSYILNLIDTPGHSDFAYEVSRALAAVEGAILLVDGTKGIQAQTLSNLRAARKAGLKIIGAVNKIDLLRAQINADDTRINADGRLDKVVKATAELLGVGEEEIFMVSAKTGEGIAALLEGVIKQVPPPRINADNMQINADAENNISVNQRQNQRISAQGSSRALIFDSLYDDHKGILAFVRAFGGEFKAGEETVLLATGAKVKIKEVGFFSPEFKPAQKISAGEIGYIATGLKEPALVKTGDTITQLKIENSKLKIVPRALPGYKEPAPVVFISFYPDGATKFEDLKKGLERLHLTDAALSFEPDANEALGRGLKVGFLGQLHFEITASRLTREFGLEFLTSFPSIAYRVAMRDSADKRGLTTRMDADRGSGLLYEDLTYKIRGCFFNVYNALGPGQKENVYNSALASEFTKANLIFEKEKSIDVIYNGKNIGTYRPDFVVDGKVIIEVKALPAIAELQKKQTWNYLKGSEYKLALLVNFGGKGLEVERIVYDTARAGIRDNQRTNLRSSAIIQRIIKQPQDFPDKPEHVWQPMIKLTILAPSEYLNQVVNLKNIFELEIKEIKNMGENLLIAARMPLAELIRDFDDQLKSVSAGYASFSYELDGEAEADVLKLEILIVGDVLPALTRIVPKKDLEHEARATVERLKKLLPKQQFVQAVQAKAQGRIIARETIPALKKLLGNFGKTGGDRTRKMKLWKKQRRGKEKLKGMARVNITPEIFREILKK